MGVSGSKLGDIAEDTPERYYGLENFGNTCYCNSVLQALYHCRPFRVHVLQHYATISRRDGQQPQSDEETLLVGLSDLFSKIGGQKKRTGVYAPRKFVAKLRKDNELFRGFMHQDAHEFLNYLLNVISDLLVADAKRAAASGTSTPVSAGVKDASTTPRTWIHSLFEGILTNETRCLTCERVTRRDECFLDLSVDISQNSSVSACLKNFSASETMCHRDKFFCDACSSLQEAEKRLKIKKPPAVLALHLKRFKYIDSVFKKLSYRVVFPFELRLFNTTDDAVDGERLYELFAVVIHIGSGPNHGHYIAIIKSSGQWLVFDDENVEAIDERIIQNFFGSTQETMGGNECGYILFYQTAA